MGSLIVLQFQLQFLKNFPQRIFCITLIVFFFLESKMCNFYHVLLARCNISKGFPKLNESRYIALFVVSGSIKMLFSVDCVNIYLSQQLSFLYIFFNLKVQGYPILLVSREYDGLWSSLFSKIAVLQLECKIFYCSCSLTESSFWLIVFQQLTHASCK